jgi:toluene monooxygenase system protein A
VKDYPLDHNDSTYHFCSKVCRQIWWEDRDTMHMKTVTERFLDGAIQPADLHGALAWMGITPDVAADDAYGYPWAKGTKR